MFPIFSKKIYITKGYTKQNSQLNVIKAFKVKGKTKKFLKGKYKHMLNSKYHKQLVLAFKRSMLPYD